jgi:hypothetical protein
VEEEDMMEGAYGVVGVDVEKNAPGVMGDVSCRED